MTSLVETVRNLVLKVTLHIYSGRPNPCWYISAHGAQELAERLSKITNISKVRPPGAAGALGYRGFSIGSVESNAFWHVYEGIVDLGARAGRFLISDTREIEEWLLNLGSSALSGPLISHVGELLAMPLFAKGGGSGGASGCPKCVAPDAPALNLAKWNTAAVQPNNNCYNYANDRITNNFAQPGDASGKPMGAMSCSGVQPSAVSDGLVATSNFTAALAAGKGFYVALVIWPGVDGDFHWYRQDKNGCWSHKPGQTAARNTDNKGATITDPKTCDRGPYTDFCSYMITNASVKVA